MRPIPVAFHIWFIEVHTYGIGLAITFWFALRYFERRVRNAGYPWEWITGMFLWVIVAAIVGARIMSVVPNWSQYSSDPLQVFAIWQGGLSSFGGLILAVPVGIVSARRRCPSISTIRLLDLVAPVLMAAWGIGRLLGPQLMVNGGGHATHQWFGMYYAGEVGKRLPVPIFQAAMDLSIFGILLLIERWLRGQAPATSSQLATAEVEVVAPAVASLGSAAGVADSPDEDSGAADGGRAIDLERRRQLPPAGIIIGAGMVLWGIERFIDERLWLTDPSHVAFILVQVAGIGLAIAGLVLLATRYPALKKWRKQGPDGPLVGGPFLGDPKPVKTRETATSGSSSSRASRSKTLAPGDSA
ncbi:MAG TPA: prolipoprotein diacylglyceryl transferase family protein [Acidimicrobiales bacterium]|jgi:phosphatidylglycerol:prolipoprotein diacylglycerol transferase|nr:prolipoprotein diacylglyceryl transferase family protein [Acidimicrobiales bacterium]